MRSADPDVVTTRPLCRGETSVIRAIFADMSPHSRYLRFHTAVPHLAPAQLRWLADVDGQDRVAVVAEAVGERGRVPVGAARLIRTSPTEAEVAVAVVDSWHRRGVATLLLADLCAVARELGIRGLLAHVLPDNPAALALYHSVTSTDGGLRGGIRVSISIE